MGERLLSSQVGVGVGVPFINGAFVVIILIDLNELIEQHFVVCFLLQLLHCHQLLFLLHRILISSEFLSFLTGIA
jgi:hypothetical protein